MSIFAKYNIYIYDIDQLFINTNKMVAKYLMSCGLPLTFDFTKKDNQTIFTHHFITLLMEFIKENPNNCKMIFYSNLLTKDPFRNKVITKIKKIFGFKIFEGIWTHSEFLKILKGKQSETLDQFELFVLQESNPKSFKHIKKYLEKEGYKSLNETYFKDVINKMMVFV